MKKPFKEYHLLKILQSFPLEDNPLDCFLQNHFRKHRQLGAKDRQFIGDTIYELVRWKSLIDFFCQGPITWEKRYVIYQNLDIKKQLQNEKIPLPTRFCMPDFLFAKIEKRYGREKAKDFCLVCTQRAPKTVRINPLKTTRNDLVKIWQSTYCISLCRQSPLGIHFHQKMHFAKLEEYKKGLFEVQDEASQLVSLLIDAKPGQKVLDFCCGAGGKTLAFGPKMQNKGIIYLHDIRPGILLQARRRIRRSGLFNIQFLKPQDTRLSRLKNCLDWVLLDVPCSGMGTWRRNPDMKWKTTEKRLRDLVQKQREIFQNALGFLKPGGKILYITCSILPEENEKQIDYFEKNYPVFSSGAFFSSFPKSDQMDGFFAAMLQKKNLNPLEKI